MSTVTITKGDNFTAGQFMSTAIDDVMNGVESGDIKVTITIENANDYTKKQRGALHVWCNLMAEALNDSGADMQKVLNRRNPVDIPWSMDRFKEFIYKPMLEAMTGMKSTEQQKTVSPSEVYNVLAKHFSQHYGVHVPWPSNKR